MPDVEFDSSFETEQVFNASIASDSEFSAEYSDSDVFQATMSTNAVFNADMSEESMDFDAEYDITEQVETVKVTSVNGMVGDVEIHIPEYVSELENDSGYITETGMDYLTNVEIEALLT